MENQQEISGIKKAIGENKLVLVYFFIPECGHCNVLNCYLSNIEHNSEGLKVIAVNMNDVPEARDEFNVTSVPTTMLFKDGLSAKTITGMITGPTMQSEIDRLSK